MRFLFMIRNDAAGASRMLGGLSSGWDDFDDALRRFGGVLVTLYAVAGRYDAVAIADFDDDAAVLAFTLAATSQGQYVEALPVFGRDQVARAEKIARGAATTFMGEMARAVDSAGGAKAGEPQS